MFNDDNRRVALRWYDEVLSGHNLDCVDDVLAPDFADLSPHVSSEGGREGMKQLLRQYFATFPDMRVAVEDVIAEGDKLAVRSAMQGTHQGAFFGLPPTGKPVAVARIDI